MITKPLSSISYNFIKYYREKNIYNRIINDNWNQSAIYDPVLASKTDIISSCYYLAYVATTWKPSNIYINDL